MSTEIKGTDEKASERGGVDGTPKNAGPVGMGGTETVGTTSRREGFVPLEASGVKPNGWPNNTAMNRSIIDGRPASRSSVVGGAAKNLAGTINGTSFRPRHP
jgi:hypothetical protein